VPVLSASKTVESTCDDEDSNDDDGEWPDVSGTRNEPCLC